MRWEGLAVAGVCTSSHAYEGNEMTATTITSDVELAHRTSDGIHVSLLWNRLTNRVRVRVLDERSDKGFELEVDGGSALDAYHHPFAYAAAELTDKLAA